MCAKEGKAAGPDGVPDDVFRSNGESVVWCMCTFIAEVWATGLVPQQWKDANIVSIYKNKGDRAICDNSRGISLLSAGGKVILKIILIRLLECIVEMVLPESQCVFRKDRSTADMVFVTQQLQEKLLEQHHSFYMFFYRTYESL